MIRVVYVKSKTLYEEDGEDMYEKDLLYITTYMYMILSLHELISRCHLVNFDLLPPSTFKIHKWHNSAYSFFFLSKTPWFCIFCLLFPNKTDNSVHKAIIGKFKNICSNYQVYVIFKVFFYFRSKKFFIIFPAWYGIN